MSNNIGTVISGFAARREESGGLRLWRGSGMNLGLEGKVALVTGASRGLGRATAEALLAEGVRVVAVARDPEQLGSLCSLHPERVTAMPADLLESQTPQRAVDLALEKYGRLDIAVVNTPGPPPKLPLAVTEADFATAFDMVFYPAFRLIQAAAKPLCAQGWGRIVIVSSTSVKAPKDFLTLSAATRSALWAWAKSAAPALFEQGVTINAVLAGPHKTDRAVQLGVRAEGIGLPQDFGAIVATMCGEATRFVTGTGQVLDGGELKGLL